MFALVLRSESLISTRHVLHVLWKNLFKKNLYSQNKSRWRYYHIYAPKGPLPCNRFYHQHSNLMAFVSVSWGMRLVRIILPHYSHASALEALNLPSLLLRRESLCSKSFSKFTASLANPLFLPLRNSSNFTLPAVRTERFKPSFIPSMLLSQ